MIKFSNQIFWLKILTCIILSALFFGCANQQMPTGGPKDIIPPKVVKELPANFTRNFSVKRILIEFDKFVKLQNEISEISMSPALDKMPTLKLIKKHLEIKFQDSLEKNTTYTINFGKGIVDVNEGNILKNYSYVFSTGNQIDSLSISGKVKSAITNTELKDLIVFILPVKQDSLFGKKKANIYTTTDSAGNFKLKNLKEDTYRIYALKKPGNISERIFNPITDEIGFLNDSIVLKNHIKDIQLNVFKEIPAKLRITSDQIDLNGTISLGFNKPASKITIIEPAELDEKKSVEFNYKKDSALVWLPQLTFDSLKIVVNEAQTRDTVTINRSKRDTYNRAVLIYDNISNQVLKTRTDFSLSFSSPIAEFDRSKVVLLQDSVTISAFELVKDSLSLRKYIIKYPWTANSNYTVKLLDSAFTDIYKQKSKSYIRKFKTSLNDDYGNLTIAVTVPDTTKSYLMQWLDDKQNLIRTDIFSHNTSIQYLNYPTGKYSIRIVYDQNKNGQWDTGNVFARRQPEKIWNYNKIITLRANWDLEEKLAIPAD